MAWPSPSQDMTVGWRESSSPQSQSDNNQSEVIVLLAIGIDDVDADRSAR